MVQVDTKENYILFRDDIEAPEGVKTVQMSTDLLEICGQALQAKDKLGDNPVWFFENIGSYKKVTE